MPSNPRHWSVTYTETRRAVVPEPEVADGPADFFADRQAAALLDAARRTSSVAVEGGAKFHEAHPIPDATATGRTSRALAVAVENADRDPFTRRRLPADLLADALIQLDAQRADLIAAREVFDAGHRAREYNGTPYVTDALGDAWDALHDAIDALDRLRARIADNPRPIPESERGTYELVMQNID